MTEQIYKTGSNPEIDQIVADALEKGKLGPGCCQIYTKKITGYNVLLKISNCGDRATCDIAVKDLEGQFISYNPGQNCP